jgi:endonuclease/exonuclease/phosphatase family metal-dependent hydrolase
VCGSEEPVYFDNESDAGANHVAWLNSFIDKHEYGTHSEPNQNQQYLCLGVVALWEMVLLVYIKSSLAPRISNVMTSTCATGVGDVLGNKGGAALSFSLDDSRVCFINSHLAARKERLLQRRQNYVKILRELKLGVPENSDLLHWFHHVIWLGDLNYRVTREWDGALLLVEKQNWRRLMLFDQMRQEMLKLSVFGGFDEGPVNFAPTYRWEKKSNAFSNKRFQSPSWTDRVVTHSFPDSGELVTTALSAVHHIHSSDHRPVFAHLSLTSRPFHHYFVPPTHTHKVRISIGGIRWQLVDKQQCESIFQHSQAVLATFSGAFLEQSMTSTIPIEKVDFQNCAALFPQNIELSLNVHDLPYLVDQHLLLTVYSSQQTSTYTNFQTHNPVSSAADVSAPQTITESRRFLKSQIQSTALLSGLHSNQKDANKDPVSTLQPHLSGESAPEQSSSTSEIIGMSVVLSQLFVLKVFIFFIL